MRIDRKDYRINGVPFSKEQIMFLGSLLDRFRDEALECLYDEESSAVTKAKASRKAMAFKRMLNEIAPALRPDA
jgi:hypothetical protein